MRLLSAVHIPEGDVALAQLVANRSLLCAATKEQSLVHKHVVGFVDAIIYTFLPIWMTILLRLVQGRPWLHRQAGRSLLIGDVPWVSQTLEAFVSKTFALSYSIATIAVSSGNPLDHLTLTLTRTLALTLTLTLTLTLALALTRRASRTSSTRQP